MSMAKARTPERAYPHDLPDTAVGALTEAVHRLHDFSHPGVCWYRYCHGTALELLAYLPDPWRLTSDPTVIGRHDWMSGKGLDADLVALLPAPWRLVKNRDVPRPAFSEDDIALLSDRANGSWLHVSWDDFGAPGPGEPDRTDWKGERQRDIATIRAAVAAARKPDLRNEGPSLSVRRFVLNLWDQARSEHGWSADDAFMLELRKQLVALRDNPYRDRRRCAKAVVAAHETEEGTT
jgi:hypothetical protein